MTVIRKTRSVCPVCLAPIAAHLAEENGAVYMEKTCRLHGYFKTLVWRGLSDFADWRKNAAPLKEGEGEKCPDCRRCGSHPQGTCCVLLEVTPRCDLNCAFCFAPKKGPEPSLDELKGAVDIILSHGRPLIQLSGGEPTVRDDLPELIRYIREKGGRYIQLNTNGLRLARDEAYAAALAEAGLSFVFLQFDAFDDEVYVKLRGRPLLDEKQAAIEACSRHGLGVVLVPTIVKGVNDGQIGDIVQNAVFMSPVVRGIHFQPVSFFGTYPKEPDDDGRYTLDELIDALCSQAGIDKKYILPSRCDHPACGFHAAFTATEECELIPAESAEKTGDVTSAEQNREYIAVRWAGLGLGDERGDGFDRLLERLGRHSFTITYMAFQDAGNLDIERLRRCSLHVYENGRLIPFCAKYLTSFKGETK